MNEMSDPPTNSGMIRPPTNDKGETKKVNKLTRIDARRLEDWVEGRRVAMEATIQNLKMLAKHAMDDLKFMVTPRNIEGAAQTMGIKIKLAPPKGWNKRPAPQYLEIGDAALLTDTIIAIAKEWWGVNSVPAALLDLKKRVNNGYIRPSETVEDRHQDKGAGQPGGQGSNHQKPPISSGT